MSWCVFFFLSLDISTRTNIVKSILEHLFKFFKSKIRWKNQFYLHYINFTEVFQIPQFNSIKYNKHQHHSYTIVHLTMSTSCKLLFIVINIHMVFGYEIGWCAIDWMNVQVHLTSITKILTIASCTDYHNGVHAI